MTAQGQRGLGVCLLLAGMLWLCGCGAAPGVWNGERAAAGTEQETGTRLVYEGSMELSYAEHFSVDYYRGGYVMLTVTSGTPSGTPEGTQILSVPEGGEIPEGLDEDVILVRRPVQNLYLVASAAMDMFDALDAVDAVTLSGQREDGWYIDSAREAMESGAMVYAGKYSEPDYERIVASGCTLAIENRMITHTPEVVEKLEEFGIPVVIDYSSDESHPLGRVEWVRFYGALLGLEERADQVFAEQTAILDRVTAEEDTGGSVAFFYVTSGGLVQVRQNSDYVPKMIELAGGRYVFENLGDPSSGRSTINLQVEEFYNGAKDADFLIYNSAVDGGVASVEELLDKCPVLADCKAVREGNVWCTANDLYQQSMSLGYLIEDIHHMLRGEDADMRFLFRLEQGEKGRGESCGESEGEGI